MLCYLCVVMLCEHHGTGVLYKSGTFYKDPLTLYAELGAKTGAYLCNLASGSNTCSSMPEVGNV
jgi:hypothetical protein